MENGVSAEEETRQPVSARRPALRSPVLLFVFLSLIYHSNLRPIASGDSLPASLIPFSLLLDGSVSLDRFAEHIQTQVPYASRVVRQKDTHLYSLYPIAGPVLTAPLYFPVAVVPWFRSQSPGTLMAVARILEKFVAAALAAATAIVVLFLLRRLTSEWAAWVLTLVFALGTANWSTASQALFQHVYGQLAIAGCLYAITRWTDARLGERWYWAAGVFAGCAIAIRPTNVAWIPALAAALTVSKVRWSQYLCVFAPVMLAGAVVAAYNFSVFGSVGGGYPARLDGHLLEGLTGVLFSPGRGLLLYTPVAVFALFAFAPRVRALRERHQALIMAASVFAVLHIVIISLWPVWWGGYCWGPRMLTEVVVPAMVLIAIGVPAWRCPLGKTAFAVVAVYCVLIQALGVYCYPKGRWDHLPVSVDEAPARLWNWADNPIVRTARGGVAWEPYAVVGAALTGGVPAASKKLQEIGINAF